MGLGTSFTTPNPYLILAKQALSKGGESKGQGPLSGVMGSRLKGAQTARGSSPSQPRTPPTHAGSNRKGWLALSGLSLSLPAPGLSLIHI